MYKKYYLPKSLFYGGVKDVQLIPIKTPLIKVGDDIIEVLVNSMKRKKVRLKSGDILVISSKVIALSEGRIIRYDIIKPSRRAYRLAKKYFLDAGFVELVLREADEIFGGVPRAILTLKNGILVPNAGIDISNAPQGHAILWPKNPKAAARKLKEEIEEKFGVKIGVIIADSHCTPLRLGTTGIAIATAGFKPVIDERGKIDLFGNKLKITLHAVADDLASAAHAIMGETNKSIPAVLIRNSGIKLENQDDYNMFMSPDKCLFSSIYIKKVKRLALKYSRS